MIELGKKLLAQLMVEKKIKPFSEERIVASGRGSSKDPEVTGAVAKLMRSLYQRGIGPKTEEEFRNWYPRMRALEESDYHHFSSRKELEDFLRQRQGEIIGEMEEQGITISDFFRPG